MFSSALHLLSRYGAAAVFAGAFFEGETVLLTASALAQQGVMSPLAVWAWGAAGAWCGHLGGFAAGRWIGRHRLLTHSARFSRRIAEVDQVVSAHPRSAIFVLQYLYGLRLVGTVAFGMTRLSWPRFALYEAINCLVWAGLVTAIGSLVGRGAASLMTGWVRWIWLGLSVLVVTWLLHRLARRFGRRG